MSTTAIFRSREQLMFVSVLPSSQYEGQHGWLAG
jgi:hypothetical protein